MSKNISLITDEYRINKKLHQDLKLLFEEIGCEVDDSRYDTTAKGGGFWSANGIMIYIALVLFDEIIVSLAKKGFKRFIDIYKQIISNKQTRCFYIWTRWNKIDIYFQFDSTDYEVGKFVTDELLIKEAIEKIPDSMLKINQILSPEILNLLGTPDSLVVKYDFSQKKWIIYKYNSTASIFYDEMPYELT